MQAEYATVKARALALPSDPKTRPRSRGWVLQCGHGHHVAVRREGSDGRRANRARSSGVAVATARPLRGPKTESTVPVVATQFEVARDPLKTLRSGERRIGCLGS